MKLFLVCLAVCVGATSVHSSGGGVHLTRCSHTAENCLKDLEIVYFSQVPGPKCMHYVLKDIYDTKPAFESIRIDNEVADANNVTHVRFFRECNGEVVKTTEVDVLETPCPTRTPFSPIKGYPRPEDQNYIVNVECEAGCPIFLSYLCSPGTGPIGSPYMALWSTGDADLKDEDFEPCLRLVKSIDPNTEMIRLKKRVITSA